MSPAPVISPELKALLRKVKLGRSLDTLPERLALAKTRGLSHGEFLELILADEATRRDGASATLRARAAGLDPTMCLDRWDDTAAVTYDRALWDELCSLRFVEAAHNLVVMGPVGVGKTFLATALGHACVRRRFSVHFERTDRLLRRLRASRLDNSHDAEVRKLLRVEVLILDDFCLQALDAADTAEVYEIIVERHRRATTVTTSNREPAEWLGLWPMPYWPNPPSTACSPEPMSWSSRATATGGDRSPRSARPTTAAHPRSADAVDPPAGPPPSSVPPTLTARAWSHATGGRVVPSCWRATLSRESSI